MTSIVELIAKQDRDSKIIEVWYINGLQSLFILKLNSDFQTISNLEVLKVAYQERFFAPDVREVFFRPESFQLKLLKRLETSLTSNLNFVYAKKNVNKPLWQKLSRSGNYIRYFNKKLVVISIKAESDLMTVRVCHAVNVMQLVKFRVQVVGRDEVVYGVMSPDHVHFIVLLRNSGQNKMFVAFINLIARKLVFRQEVFSPSLTASNFNLYIETGSLRIKGKLS